MHISQRSSRLSESSTARVFRLAKELKAAGKDIIDLSAGQPDFPSPQVAVEGAVQALRQGFTRYTLSSGTTDLRAALAQRYQERYAAPWGVAQTVITVGAKAALFQLMQTLLDDGDTAVLSSPCWVSFTEQIRFAGGRPILVPTGIEDSFCIRSEPLIDALEPSTRLVLINSPSNPTGGCISAPGLRRLVSACAERGIVVVCDETYERFVYDGRTHASAAELAAEFPQTVIVVGSFSKTFSMTGWRVGWVLGPDAVMQKVAALQSHMTSNVTSFAMQGALAALEGGESQVQEMLSAFAARRRLIVDQFARLPGFRCPPPMGAFYAFPDVSNCLLQRRHGKARYREGRHVTSMELAEFLLQEAGVAVVPGEAFQADHHLRFSFACSESDLTQAFSRIRQALRL